MQPGKSAHPRAPMSAEPIYSSGRARGYVDNSSSIRGSQGRRRFAMARPVCGFDNAIDPGRDEGLA